MGPIDMQYIGACKLLARVSDEKRLTEEQMNRVKVALDDCAASYPGRFEVVKVLGGYSLEPVAREQETT